MKRTIRKEVKFYPKEWYNVCAHAKKRNERTGTYIRKIAVEGIIHFFDMKQFDHLIMAFNRVGNEINQIVKVVNSTEEIYGKDIDDLEKSFEYLETVFENYLLPIKSQEIMTGEYPICD